MLAIGTIIRFIFGQGLSNSLSTPLNNQLMVDLAPLSTFGYTLEIASLALLSFSLWRKMKLFSLTVAILLFATFASILPIYTSIVFPLTLVLIFMSSIVMFQGLYVSAKKRITSSLLAPIYSSVILLYFVSLSLFLNLSLPIISYVIVYGIMVFSFLAYSITYTVKPSPSFKRYLISYVAGGIAFASMIPFYILVSTNRFMEIIMENVIPYMTGFVLYNPYLLPLAIIFSAIALFSIISLAIKGNPYAALGFFMIITSAFMATVGFGLLLLIVSPAVGSALITYNEIKEKNAQILLDQSEEE
ncbi:hypothetical protein [Candidatus Acidianus copahuensis]|uniref:hypothetical protein n=1 Tax=Candidatus Acidianus copahuensis TaxID=1160895 RepID=UPI0012377FB6|nr:hypothetical protein [Candidatus Acidianus copahuensis]